MNIVKLNIKIGANMLSLLTFFILDSKNCKTCDRVLSVLERVGEEVAGNGITLVRINDKKASKVHGIRNYPALSLFKMGEAIHYEVVLVVIKQDESWG